MALLEWQEDYSVGVKALDDQHKKMFSIINDFYDQMKAGQDNDLGKILQELVAYGQYHLTEEEKYFEQFDYPDKVSHMQIHDAYRKKIAEFTASKDEALVSFDIIDYLEDWWLEHVTGADKKYAKFFNEHGLH